MRRKLDLARSCFSHRDFERCVELCRECDGEPFASGLAGAALFELGRVEEGLIALHRAWSANPADKLPIVMLAASRGASLDAQRRLAVAPSPPPPTVAPFRRLLTIGGAPRTGTTMLLRALDWHPEILAFPRELQVVVNAFHGGTGFPATGCKELAYLDPSRLSAHAESCRKAGATRLAEHYERFDAARFEAAYYYEPGSNIVDCHLNGLAAGMMAASPGAGARYARPVPWFAVKMPFFTEMTFPLTDGAALIHIDRDPVRRHASAKMRVLKNGGLPVPVGPLDYASFNVFLQRASKAAASRHAERHPGRVLFLRYEDLRAETTLETLRDFLGVAWDDSLTRQTVYGIGDRLRSSFGFVAGDPAGEAGRDRATAEIVSPAEAAFVKALHDGDIAAARAPANETFPAEDSESRAVRLRFLEDAETWRQFPELFLELLRAVGADALYGLAVPRAPAG
ncbi:MAG: sulfotransferase [Alphaproteobacteria bacterium]|nr:sulfotransferase [Alphaproteobacteria bacterium]